MGLVSATSAIAGDMAPPRRLKPHTLESAALASEASDGATMSTWLFGPPQG